MEPQIQKSSSLWFRLMRYFFFSTSLLLYLYSFVFFQELPMLCMFLCMLGAVVVESMVGKKHKRMILLSVSLLIIEFIVTSQLGDQPDYDMWNRFRMLLGVFIFSLLSPLITEVKHYPKIFLGALGLLIIGVFFKVSHFPGGSVILVVSVFFMTIVFIVQWFYSFRFLKTNMLLMFASLLCNFVVIVFYLGWLFRTMHWQGAAIFTLNNYFAPLFGLVSASLIIGVQMNDFTSWLESQRKYLVNNILIPWFVVFLIGGWMLLFEQSFNNLMIGASYVAHNPFDMQDYSIDDLPK